jgi:hypothetical protein
VVTTEAKSRAVLILGMHRSGTSAFARGMQALGVYLGTNFLETRPDNPTGYWEDKQICQLNENVLEVLGLKWTDGSLIEADWDSPAMERLQFSAAEYLRANFMAYPLWGFKDPRTIRLLPFWQAVMRSLGADECYLLAIRNPLSVAASLFKRQGMDAPTAHRLWLAYVVPYLDRLAARRFVVSDYDLMLERPEVEFKRISSQLGISLDQVTTAGMRHFAENFLDPNLRHNSFGEMDFDPAQTPLSRAAYLWLRQLATGQLTNDSFRFWSAWEHIQRSVEGFLKQPVA